ncbi:hypothetical protein ACI0FM_08610 [Paenochrobactrum sp. BZR 588]|uniref:hypothetical protein n=1 Tax=unclassified Paenochrobactrum TaxID=2639760 RepID=UPI0038543740
METEQFIEIFTHVRILIAMIISISVARILSGVAKFLQHPKRNKLSALHLLWAFSILLELILFWWWGVRLGVDIDWTFSTYMLHITYGVTLYLMSALLFPDDILEYQGYQDFFIQRRYWFFTLLASTWVIDIAKTIAVGGNVSSAFVVHAFTTISVCILAVIFKNPKIQIALVLIYIARQLFSI